MHPEKNWFLFSASRCSLSENRSQFIALSDRVCVQHCGMVQCRLTQRVRLRQWDLSSKGPLTPRLVFRLRKLLRGGFCPWVTLCSLFLVFINAARIVCGLSWSRVYVRVGRPSIRLSVPSINSNGSRRVCCWASCGKEMFIHSYIRAPCCRRQRPAANAGSVTLTADEGGSVWTCLLSTQYN